MNADHVTSGEFPSQLEKGYILVPFDVPAQIDGAPVTAVRVKYCYDQPDLPVSAVFKNVLDLGLYEPRTDPSRPWGPDEFRGWGGSSHPDVTLSPDGFEAKDGGTTKAFLPGPIPAGEWAAELGAAAIASDLEGNLDNKVAWRLEVDLITDPSFADEPYGTTPCAAGGKCPYDSAPAVGDPGWYSGDFHVHGDHSARQDAPMREVFNYSFCPDPELGSLCSEAGAQPGANLDFITLSDYVGGSSWGEIGRFQEDYPKKLIIRSAEVITYRGHANNHAVTEQADYRTGPVYVRSDDGALVLARGPRPASGLFDFVHAQGGFTQINHPTIFPTLVPGFDFLCRGCPWDYSAGETDYSKVDAIEVATGPAGIKESPQPGPNPFTATAIQFWEDGIDAGGLNSNKIAAVGSSDSHNAGRVNDPLTQAPIGQATTVVRATELSEKGIREGVQAGHTYVKMWGADGPDLRLRADLPGQSEPAGIMGDTVRTDEGATLRASVLNLNRAQAARPGLYTLFLYRNGQPFLAIPLPAGKDNFEFSFPSLGPARYRLQVQRLITGVASIEAISSPIYIEPAGTKPPGPPEESCSLVVRGTAGDDTFRGTSESDAFRGRKGADSVRGRGADDCLNGGRNRDSLRGGPGGDQLRGGGGRDRIHSRDGNRDVVRCGTGRRDRASVDRVDQVGPTCERVQTPR